MGKEPAGNQIHVFPGTAETIPCPHGAPFPDLPTSFLLGAPTASARTMIILNLLLRCYKDQFARIWIFFPSIKLDPQYAPLRRQLEKMTEDLKTELFLRQSIQYRANVSGLKYSLESVEILAEPAKRSKKSWGYVCVRDV